MPKLMAIRLNCGKAKAPEPQPQAHISKSSDCSGQVMLVTVCRRTTRPVVCGHTSNATMLQLNYLFTELFLMGVMRQTYESDNNLMV
jgi:hypothetical protein